MATEWYFELGEDELGPVSFQDLVELIRAGVLTEDATVRSSWNTNSQRAHSVIGLIYMAQRPVAKLDNPPAVSDNKPLSDAEKGTSDTDAPVRPEWLERLLELRTTFQMNDQQFDVAESDIESGSVCRVDEPNPEVSIPSGIDPVEAPAADGPLAIDFMDRESQPAETVGHSSSWKATMEAALSHVDARLPRSIAKPRGRMWQVCTRIANVIYQAAQSREFIGQVFRIGSAIVVANLTALWIANWSDHQALRFPPRPGQKQAAISEFPLIGKCSSSEYAVLVVHFVLICGGSAYGIATVLVSHAEK